MTVLIAGLAAVLGAVGIVDLAEASASSRRAPRTRRRPARHLLVAFGRRVGRPPAAADLPNRLSASAAPVTLEELLALKGGAAATALLASLPAAALAPGRLGLLVPAAAAGGAYALPDIWLRRRARSRAARMQAEMADVADLLRVALDAGLPVRRAIADVGRRHGGLLAAELRRAAGNLALGQTRAAALAELRRRAPTAGVIAMLLALERAERLGTPPGEALAALARESRADRARAATENAARAAPKVQLVVALLLVPSVMLLVAAALAPAVL